MIVFFSCVIIVGALYCLFYFHRKKYTDFIEKNSIALKNLRELNALYSFYPYVDFDQTHTYDNKKYYDAISCSDYLIHQLQYISCKVQKQIKKLNINKKEYQSYIESVNLIEVGQFQSPIEKLKLEKLLKIEKLKIKKNIHKRPVTEFSITVTLYCATMNGYRYNQKSEIFFADEMISFIKRLKNKNGTFYNDREIWNSLCRVERGKVSNKMRFAIYKKDGYRCRHCGAMGKYVNLEIDHIIPIAKGGKTTYKNLQTLCRRCNYDKGDKLYY